MLDSWPTQARRWPNPFPSLFLFVYCPTTVIAGRVLRGERRRCQNPTLHKNSADSSASAYRFGKSSGSFLLGIGVFSIVSCMRSPMA